MQLVKANGVAFGAVVRAWRVARWANHAWGQIPASNLVEVWNLCPSIAGFAEILPGYCVARGWVVEGVLGWGILGPDLIGDNPEEQGLRVAVGSHAQMRVDCYPTHTLVRYQHAGRWAEVVAEGDGVVFSADGLHAAPRDWARLARVLLVAYDLSHESAEGVIESLRGMAGEDGLHEFERYAAMEGPEVFASPAVFAGGQ